MDDLKKAIEKSVFELLQEYRLSQGQKSLKKTNQMKTFEKIAGHKLKFPKWSKMNIPQLILIYIWPKTSLMVRTSFKLNLRLNQITQGGLNYCIDYRDDKHVILFFFLAKRTHCGSFLDRFKFLIEFWSKQSDYKLLVCEVVGPPQHTLCTLINNVWHSHPNIAIFLKNKFKI